MVYYNYPSSGSVGDRLIRLNDLAGASSGGTKYAEYVYLGASTIVKVAHPGVTNGMDLTYGSAAKEERIIKCSVPLVPKIG